MLDLFALNRLQLVGAGVPARAIERVGGCTGCDTGPLRELPPRAQLRAACSTSCAPAGIGPRVERAAVP